MKDYALVIDFKYCTGCHTCEVACRQEKDFPTQEEWGIKVVSIGPDKFGDKWYWNNFAIPSSLCDLCIDRIEAGKKPACAHHCLAQCMCVVPVNEIPEKLKELGEGASVFNPA